MSALVKLLARLFTVKVVWDRLRKDKKNGSPSANTAPLGRPSAAPASGPPGASSETPSQEGGAIPSQTAGGAGPGSPLELESQDWKATAKRTVTEIKEDRVTLAAAGMAFYFFLALFPALIAVIGIYDLVSADSKALTDSIREALPTSAGSFVTDALAHAEKPSQGASVVAAITGIALALWSASSGMVAMQSGLNIAYDVPTDRKFIGKRAVALLLILVTILLGSFPSPLFTWGDDTIFTVMGYVLSVVAIMVLFSLYYYLGPKRESPRWTWVSAGGVVGGLIWIIASIGFGLYVDEFGANYGKTYGTAAGIVVLIFWLFITSISVLVGGELNAEIERQAERRKRADKGH